MKPLLVGEDNPYSTDPRYALYPLPVNSAGWRLCHRVIGVTTHQYLRHFDRVNLCAGKWSTPEAKATASKICNESVATGRVVVLLGTKVTRAAFNINPEPFRIHKYYQHCDGLVSLSCHVVVLPHPSGLSRVWNEPGAFERARKTLREAGVLPLPTSHPQEVA